LASAVLPIDSTELDARQTLASVRKVVQAVRFAFTYAVRAVLAEVLKVFQAALIAAFLSLAVVIAQAAAKSEARFVKAAEIADDFAEKADETAASRLATAAAAHGKSIVFFTIEVTGGTLVGAVVFSS
jgi:hypothetical protein